MNDAFDNESLSFVDITRKLKIASFYLKKSAKILINRDDFQSAEGALNLANRIDMYVNNL